MPCGGFSTFPLTVQFCPVLWQFYGSSVAIIHCPGRLLSTDRRWPRQKRDSEALYCAARRTSHPPPGPSQPQPMSDTTSTPPQNYQLPQLLPFLLPQLHTKISPKFFHIYIFPISQYHYSLLYCNCIATLAHFTVFLLLLACLAHRPVSFHTPLRLLTAPCVPQTFRSTTSQVTPVTYRLPDDLFASH